MVLQHRKVGVKERDVRRQMENRMDGRREREKDAERVMITIFAPQPPPPPPHRKP